MCRANFDLATLDSLLFSHFRNEWLFFEKQFRLKENVSHWGKTLIFCHNQNHSSDHNHKIVLKFLIWTWLQYRFKMVIWGIQVSVSNTFRRHLRSFVGIIFNTHIKSQASYVTKNGVPFVFFLLEETFSLSLLGSMGVRSRMQQLKYVIYTLINSHY